MAVIWCGGEDIDFPNGVTQVVTNSNYFRSGFARCGLNSNTGAYTLPFAGQTSFWVSAQVAYGSGGWGSPFLFFGVTNHAAPAYGLFLGGVAGSNPQRLGLYLVNASGTTLLAQSYIPLFSGTLTTSKLDMQVSNFGGSGTVNVYYQGQLVINYSGVLTISGVTTLDTLTILGTGGLGLSAISEFIVATVDTRNFPGLVTLAITGAGTTDQWTGTYSNVNGISFSDTNPITTNTAGQDEQFTVNGLPTTNTAIAAVKISARMAAGSGGATSTVELGYNDSGTVGFGTGASKSLTGAYSTYEQLDIVNPVSGVAFTPSDIAALQIDLRSA